MSDLTDLGIFGLTEFETVVLERCSSAIAIVAIDSTVLGPAVGRLRRTHYGSLTEGVADALILARAMTLKAGVAGLPYGGGKAVLYEKDPMDIKGHDDSAAQSVTDARRMPTPTSGQNPLVRGTRMSPSASREVL